MILKIPIILLTALLISCAAAVKLSPKQLAEGKALAFKRSKGNCLACHVIEDGETPGNIGPRLANISARFADKKQLRDFIWDATRFNPQTSMPPFGKNKILTEPEIDKIVDYLWSLS